MTLRFPKDPGRFDPDRDARDRDQSERDKWHADFLRRSIDVARDPKKQARASRALLAARRRKSVPVTLSRLSCLEKLA